MPKSPKAWIETLTLIIFFGGFVAAVVLPFTFIAANKIKDVKIYIAVCLTSIFIFAVVSTFCAIFLWGTNDLNLASAYMNWLGGATVGEIAGMLYIVVKVLFPTPERERPSK